MTPDTAALAAWLLAYFVGAVPFGYLAGRAKGVDLFKAGSGNVGATNAGRVLGPRVGAAVFACDFLKGVLPVALAPRVAGWAGGSALDGQWLQIGAAAAAFLGHVYPVTLGFRGGKGVATGSGVIMVIEPIASLSGYCAWAVTLLGSRMVSAASLAAAGTLVIVRLVATPDPLGAKLPGTLFCVAGALLVAVRHRANVARIAAGTETRVRDFAMRVPLLTGLHLLALGFWFGGAAFFSFLAAPAIFAGYAEVVAESPSGRTAGLDIVPPGSTPEQKKALASALAGAAVGPVFPRFFAAQAVAATVALATSLGLSERRRWRVLLLAAGLGMVAAGWPISRQVSAIRAERTSPDAEASRRATEAFGPWHLLSLGLSAATTLAAGAALATAGRGGPLDRATSPASSAPRT